MHAAPGRTNERDCIHFALTCDGENPAAECSMGKGLPWSEFTTAKAAKKSRRGNYRTAMIGKWHLGDLCVCCMWRPPEATHSDRSHRNEKVC